VREFCIPEFIINFGAHMLDALIIANFLLHLPQLPPSPAAWAWWLLINVGLHLLAATID
jgi:hypothetical protein